MVWKGFKVQLRPDPSGRRSWLLQAPFAILQGLGTSGLIQPTGSGRVATRKVNVLFSTLVRSLAHTQLSLDVSITGGRCDSEKVHIDNWFKFETSLCSNRNRGATKTPLRNYALSGTEASGLWEPQDPHNCGLPIAVVGGR
jgi:hypothetical protein